jgi:hypothetical protein
MRAGRGGGVVRRAGVWMSRARVSPAGLLLLTGGDRRTSRGRGSAGERRGHTRDLEHLLATDEFQMPARS